MPQVDLLLFTILNGISWYCVVKRLGCCGRAGYLVWAAVYVLLNLGRLQAISWSSCYLIYLLMIVPAGYMVVALIQLFRGAPRGLLSGAAFFASSEARQELLHAYDVAAILTLYNDLCREEGSTSHSIKDSWECKLYDIKVTSPSGDVEWDPVMNRAPPDSDKDSVLLNGTRGLFESAAAKDSFLKGLAGQRAAELQHICSDRFFQTHVVIGDDPHKVPFGDTEAFAKVVPEVRLGLDQANGARRETGGSRRFSVATVELE
ncbi:unnamed protein product [Effrenium voratum]|uniref:Uncharacterized protein n=1 Tax=Effrenium voratum TaxID=2562239 RepID=A0AA36NJ85_9DINO|nr:unnamed protein product [Effrenium voratum]